MAENLLSRMIKGDQIKNYAYLSSLEEIKGYSKIVNRVKSTLNSINSEQTDFIDHKSGLNNLEKLIEKEKLAEKQFLETYFKISVDPDDIGDLIKHINIVLQGTNSLKTSLNSITNSANATSKATYIINSPLYRKLSEEIPRKIGSIVSQYFSNEINRNNSNEIIIKELSEKILEALTPLIKSAISSIDTTNSKEDSNLLKYYNTLSKLEQDNFIKQVLEAYGLTATGMNSLIERTRNTFNKNAKEKNVSKKITFEKKKQGGYAFEELIALSLEAAIPEDKKGNRQVGKTAKLNNMKADQLLLFQEQVTINMADLITQMEESIQSQSGQGLTIREKNIEAINELESNLRKAKASIVEISDKNYNLTGSKFLENHGFQAENPNLYSLQATLLKRASQELKVRDLIFLLVNSGNLMVNGRNYDNALRIIAENIGAFLFDDLSITQELDDNISTPNRIHLFNLNGVYVPLSLFLKAAKQALESNKGYTDYISVDFHSHNVRPEGNLSSEKAWKDFYDTKMRGSKASNVSIHFFGNFVNYITENMKNITL